MGLRWLALFVACSVVSAGRGMPALAIKGASRGSLHEYSETLDHMTKETMGGLVPGDGRKGYTAYAFFQIKIAGKTAGTIKVGLYGGIVPVTVANFIGLLIHQKGYGYRGSTFHRVIKGFMIQGGAFETVTGELGGTSIWGHPFMDENFKVKHKRGVLSMANSGKNSNGSQFFITTADTPHLDRKHVVFGEVISGMGVVDKVEKVRTGVDDSPRQLVQISHCGLLSDPREGTKWGGGGGEPATLWEKKVYATEIQEIEKSRP
mmetsp:Transcript_65805/g.208267  ORF Transcript_65805/g.208267 Transcript_65805/m.208267 type:complete len:262 (-) Transcript_65805:48-833(-)